jgi:hypothetical protein
VPNICHTVVVRVGVLMWCYWKRETLKRKFWAKERKLHITRFVTILTVDEQGVFNYFNGLCHDTWGVKWWTSTTVSVLSHFMPCLVSLMFSYSKSVAQYTMKVKNYKTQCGEPQKPKSHIRYRMKKCLIKGLKSNLHNKPKTWIQIQHYKVI